MDAFSSHSSLLMQSGALRPARVVVYLVENGTSGPVARAAKVARQLKDAGAQVTVLMPKERMDSPLFAPDIPRVAYDVARIWRPSPLNPQWQIAKLRPDALLVDEYPFIAEEHARAWEPVIDMAKRANRRCVVHGMSCDIPIYYKDAEAPNLPKRTKRLDHIWVTGDPTVTDFTDYVHEDALPHIAPKLNYSGFMNEPPTYEVEETLHKSDKKEILVYLGGGHVSRLANRYVSLLANLPQMSEELKHAHWRFVLPEDYDFRSGSKIYQMLENLPDDMREHVTIEQTDQHFSEKMKRADMVITGGGQSAIEAVLAEEKPTVILPAYFGEQFARAKDFAARFPEQVAAADLPTLKVPPMTTKRLRHNQLNGIEEKHWIEQTLEWAETDPDCRQMRSSMEKIFAAKDSPHPHPQIMLEGAQRIANETVMRSAYRGRN